MTSRPNCVVRSTPPREVTAEPAPLLAGNKPKLIRKRKSAQKLPFVGLAALATCFPSLSFAGGDGSAFAAARRSRFNSDPSRLVMYLNAEPESRNSRIMLLSLPTICAL